MRCGRGRRLGRLSRATTSEPRPRALLSSLERSPMAHLIYAVNTTLDGFTEDHEGGFDWMPPDDEAFSFFVDTMTAVGTCLYGRRMYETLAVWETDPDLADASPLAKRFAQAWQAADKIVYSTELPAACTSRTRLERQLDAGAVLKMKSEASKDLLVGGPNVANQLLQAGLVDVLAVVVWPLVLSGRNPAFSSNISNRLDPLDQATTRTGAMCLRYRAVRTEEPSDATGEEGGSRG